MDFFLVRLNFKMYGPNSDMRQLGMHKFSKLALPWELGGNVGFHPATF